MSSKNEFKRALAEGRPQIGIWSTLPYPYISELIAGCGYDWMLLDTEHTPTEVTMMMHQLQAVDAAAANNSHRTHSVVRPAWNDTVLIKRYLDIGAKTLLLPFVQNAEEAKAAVAATRYAPNGVRGMGGATRASDFGRAPNYALTADQDMCVLVQIETASALEKLEEIASVEGVDGVFIGPADLSASMGYAENPRHPAVDAAINDAIRRIKACGKAPGILMIDPVRAKECLDLGALFVAVAIDLLALRGKLEETVGVFKSDRSSSAPTGSY
ncbi:MULTISPECIES: aldolase/citrate lyase family protein [unclassified Pseudomonas]|uniref:aldolase/citrate lyase family protein n=1 Tax=unclassified Pseudomonas TaxID=196821 RepID=UPI000D9D470B|nr:MULTISPECIES: aldolase/citrate lyase family protein [unclassified Pseudomonas]PYG78421.1 4-hydroxy-2-oxoheptanedioate aldolase [Pseudomonas sp. RV120224-01c]PYG82637.1 4-hydroxy-2-oxoheptanedioate aldolase [Pseudomonas sp. RV120224-01b]